MVAAAAVVELVGVAALIRWPANAAILDAPASRRISGVRDRRRLDLVDARWEPTLVVQGTALPGRLLRRRRFVLISLMSTAACYGESMHGRRSAVPPRRCRTSSSRSRPRSRGSRPWMRTADPSLLRITEEEWKEVRSRRTNYSMISMQEPRTRSTRSDMLTRAGAALDIELEGAAEAIGTRPPSSMPTPVHQRAGMAEDRRSWDRGGLRPLILLCVVDLNVVYQATVGAAADQINEAISIDTDYRIAHRERNVGAAQPTVSCRLVHSNVGQSHCTLGILYVAAENE